MKSKPPAFTARCHRTFAPALCLTTLLALSFATLSCRPKRPDEPSRVIAPLPALDPIAIVLAPHAGDGKADEEIRRLQQRLRDGRQPELTLERLGWAFVARARESFDAGFYKLAEQCAFALRARQPGGCEALLLHGHVLHSLHRFQEAETLARQLVGQRGLAFDYGLLGDVLMEQGKLAEAIDAYQHMINLKPDLHAYARAAHLRWLKGDLTGAIEAMELAAGAASPLDAESAAWVNTRLAGYEFQAGHFEPAEQRCMFALSFQTNYAPALLLRGRMRLARNQPAEAIELLQTAARLNPLPEYQWTLTEALRAADRGSEAGAIEEKLRRHGTAADPRTLALFLATMGESPDAALRLARAELEVRDDVFTHDALAWSLAAAGRYPEARDEIERALAEGTRDGRLLFHAAVIAAQSGNTDEARSRFEQARELTHLLLPSERKQLQSLAPRFAPSTAAQSTVAGNNFSALRN